MRSVPVGAAPQKLQIDFTISFDSFQHILYICKDFTVPNADLRPQMA
jgi:hypothetical protein